MEQWRPKERKSLEGEAGKQLETAGRNQMLGENFLPGLP